MSAPKHTPGPWTLGTFPDGRPCGCLIGPNGCMLPFDNCGMGSHISSGSFDPAVETTEVREANRLANAALIAAAPELLEALKTTVAAIKAFYSPKEAPAGLLVSACVAIERAEGKKDNHG